MIYRLAAPLIYHNTKSKVYPDGHQKITICTRPIFRDDGWEPVAPDAPGVKESKPKDMSNEVRADSVKRAKERVFDIAYCNDFTHFITWTLDQAKIDRYDSKEVSRKLKKYLDNHVQRHDLKYLVIPEHHKDGAIHMHGLISGDVDLIDSGHTTKDGKRIYNMPQWTLGYSTAIELDQHKDRIAKYITKYITKDFAKIFGSFYYAGGHGLIRKPPVILYDTDYLSVNAEEYTVQAARLGFKYISVDSSGE